MLLTLGITNSYNRDMVLSVNDLKTKFLTGLPLPDSLSDETLSFFILSSIGELENHLGIKLRLQVVEESEDFHADDHRQWGFIKVSYPVRCVVDVSGFLNTTKQVQYPKEWLSVKRSPNKKQFSRIINIVPTQGSSSSAIGVYGTIFPTLANSRTIPNYWRIQYLSGWRQGEVPNELLEAVGVLTSIKVLQQISDALMAGSVKVTVDQNGRQILAPSGSQFGGIGLGMSSKSISIDGLSQNYSSYANGQTGIWGARLKQYSDMMNPSMQGSFLNRLFDTYGAIVMGVA